MKVSKSGVVIGIVGAVALAGGIYTVEINRGDSYWKSRSAVLNRRSQK